MLTIVREITMLICRQEQIQILAMCRQEVLLQMEIQETTRHHEQQEIRKFRQEEIQIKIMNHQEVILEIMKHPQEVMPIKEINHLVLLNQEQILREKCRVQEIIQADKEKYQAKEVIHKEATMVQEEIKEVKFYI